MQSSGGFVDTDQQGHFGCLNVWYHPRALGNVLSLALVETKCRVVMDTGQYGNAFYVYLSDEHFIKFECLHPGLYVYDASHTDIPKLRHAFNFLTTVSEKLELWYHFPFEWSK